jgi:hypothetical protein
MSELSELFARDPLALSDQDITEIVARMREAQAQFELGIKAPKAAAKPKSTKTKDLLKDLGLGADDVLGDLGLK